MKYYNLEKRMFAMTYYTSVTYDSRIYYILRERYASNFIPKMREKIPNKIKLGFA